MEAIWDENSTMAVRLMERIRSAFIKQNAKVYRQFKAACEANPYKEMLMQIEVEGFTCEIHHDDWFVVYRWAVGVPDRPVQVFDGKLALGRPNYTWDYHVIKDEVLPALDRFLVLEDLAEI